MALQNLTLPAGAAWHEDANCRDVPVEVFFSNDDADQRRALELCRGCLVREECLRWAVEREEMYGVWGGLQENQRRSIIRDVRRQQRERARRERERRAA